MISSFSNRLARSTKSSRCEVTELVNAPREYSVRAKLNGDQHLGTVDRRVRVETAGANVAGVADQRDLRLGGHRDAPDSRNSFNFWPGNPTYSVFQLPPPLPDDVAARRDRVGRPECRHVVVR